VWERTILSNANLPWPYNLYFDIFAILLILIVGVPTIYAMWFGAPWVPTPMRAVRIMLKEAKLKKQQTAYDLGCGDGRLVIEASKISGVKGIGFEISTPVYVLALIRNLINGFKAKILLKSFWRYDISDANVVFLYLLPKSMKKLKLKFEKELKKGTLVISYAFKIDGLKLEKKIERDRERNICPIWIYKI